MMHTEIRNLFHSHETAKPNGYIQLMASHETSPPVPEPLSPKPSRVDRVAVYASIPSSIASVATLIASFSVHVPKDALLSAVGVAGASLTLLSWKKVPADRKILLRNVIPVGAIATTALVVVAALLWTGRSASKVTPETRMADVISTLGSHITPAMHAEIGTCTQVTGNGRIPAGFHIWVANLNDKDGEPDTSELFSFQTIHPTGPNAWATNPFAVGVPDPTDPNFWINVYLVPDSVDSVLANIALPKSYSVSLKAPIRGAYLIAQIPVVRNSSKIC